MRKTRALDAFNLRPTDRIPHWEHFSNPAFEEAATGIDPWRHPQRARRRMLELLPMDIGSVPAADEPIERPPEGKLTFVDAEGRQSARWGTGSSWHWDWGRRFTTLDDVVAYDPLADMDQSQADVVANLDYRLSVDELAAQYRSRLDSSRAATGDLALPTLGYYNTLFMWPLLTFGWELFLEVGAAHRAEMKRLFAGFAERSRLVFQALARTDAEVITSHDDICFQAGPTFSPKWLREFVYPYYEEFWSYPRAAGQKVIFICDGNVTRVADDVFACGAAGICSEPYTDWRAIARNHPDRILAGDGDNRVLLTEDREAIFAMVREMADFGRNLPGYFFCCGNHLPWTLSASSIQDYFDASQEYGGR
ncbi:MAG: hypothetical protein HYY04_00250 [Chloroflexi bacterium]|nr:hypothetical protein [Chloroflexota bacterium]